MKKLNIDTKKHMGYSRSAERGIKARLSQKYSPVECERLMEMIDQKYEEFLVDLPYCGGKHNLMIWQLYDAIAAFAYYEVLPEKKTIPNEKFLEETKTQARSYANLLKTRYSIIAAKGKVWVTSEKDDYSKTIFEATWEELNDPDTYYQLEKMIGFH